jgi:hypothetical protein
MLAHRRPAALLEGGEMEDSAFKDAGNTCCCTPPLPERLPCISVSYAVATICFTMLTRDLSCHQPVLPTRSRKCCGGASCRCRQARNRRSNGRRPALRHQPFRPAPLRWVRPARGSRQASGWVAWCRFGQKTKHRLHRAVLQNKRAGSPHGIFASLANAIAAMAIAFAIPLNMRRLGPPCIHPVVGSSREVPPWPVLFPSAAQFCPL